jgi:hypothetical protein
MTSAFDVAYLSNRHCRWFRAPVFLEKLRPTQFGRDLDFRSRYGITEGPNSPSECGYYWYRFLPRRPHTLAADDVPPDRLRELGRAIGSLSAATGKPLVFKNVILSLRIPLLVNVFPDAVFIVCQRNAVDTAVSILRGRERQFGDLDHWFSLRPSNCTQMHSKHDPFEQVVAQIKGTYEEVQQARASVPATQFIDIDYEALCRTPRSELDRLQLSLAHAGATVERRPGFDCPERFPVSHGSKNAPAAWLDRIHASLNSGSVA